jgi:regulator of sigma D
MPKVVDKYTKERQEVLDKMFSILGINENNNKFLLHELDTDEKKQQDILNLEPEIKKYFICGKWSCFKNPNMKREALSYFKHVVKDMGLIVMITDSIIDFKRRKIYSIVKNI